MQLPRMVRVRQRFADEHIDDVAAVIRSQMAEVGLAARLRPGARVAITAGSRGIFQIDRITRAVVDAVREAGGKPFIVPAMGSHGGATAEGQREVLAGYGITESSMDCLILSSMETVVLGMTPGGATVHMDKNAYNADHTIVVGRVKAHTAFRGPIESGLCKMIAVGLGKQRGAEEMHARGLGENIPAAAALAIEKANILLGVAIVENSYDHTHTIRVVPPERIHDTDRELLVLANSLLPRVPFDALDTLIVDWMGKNISGSGMDYNIIGMWRRIGGPRIPDYKRIVVLDLTPESHGNGLGVGAADFTTKKLVQKLDLRKMYMNCLTSNAIDAGKIPITLDTDREAIEAAIKSAGVRHGDDARVVRIKSTLHLDELQVSEALLDEVRRNPNLEIIGEPEPMRFDEQGNLL
jgi:hypothetical protein